MNLSEFLRAAAEAWALLAVYPFRWVAVVIVFLVLVESLMLIPYVGFVVKLAVAGIVVPQVVYLFAEASRGQAPSPLGLMGAFSISPSTMVVLVGASILPFAVGILFLYFKGGAPAIEFFFGNMFKAKPPAAAQFAQFKYVMQVMAIPFTLLAGAVAVKGLAGGSALAAALSSAVTNWLPVALLALLALAFEWSSALLPSVMPKPAAALVGIVLLLGYLAWSFAVTYTVSAKVFGAPVVRGAA